MTIAELIDGLPVSLIRGPRGLAVRDVVEDSRRASPGCLFAARAGTAADGRTFIGDAVDRGAAAILLGHGLDAPTVPAGVAVLEAPDVAAVLPQLAERFFGYPSRSLRLVGVTGTNGKTTVAHLTQRILVAAGLPCGLVGTVRIDTGDGTSAASLTTPPAVDLSRHLARMADNGCRAAVLEVSSHALAQGRAAALRFDVAVFTNLSGDHLDYHGTPEAYAAAKALLFRELSADAVAVVNADDPATASVLGGCAARVIATSLTDPSADCFAAIRSARVDGLDAEFTGPWGSFDLRLPLAGTHNASNALQAAAAASAAGADGGRIRAALSACTAPPGRLEPVAVPGGRFSVLVDYAHTDDALASALASLRGLVPRGARLRVVFGCGGDRDRTKRPRMGRVAADLADDLVVTSDNPRTEDPASIIAGIERGIPAARRGSVTTIPDRRAAIRHAVGQAGPGDVVLIAGKGHEPWQIFGTEKRPFDDRAVAAEACAALAAP